MSWNVLSLFVYFVSQCIHPPTHPYISFRIFLNFLFLLFFVMRHRPCTWGWCVICAHASWRMASICASTLCPLDQKVLELHVQYVTCTLNTKFETHTPGEFPGYWWLFRTQHLLRNGARLAEERIWTILIFDRFRFATLKQLLHTAITTADWRRLYELLYE